MLFLLLDGDFWENIINLESLLHNNTAKVCFKYLMMVWPSLTTPYWTPSWIATSRSLLTFLEVVVGFSEMHLLKVDMSTTFGWVLALQHHNRPFFSNCMFRCTEEIWNQCSQTLRSAKCYWHHLIFQLSHQLDVHNWNCSDDLSIINQLSSNLCFRSISSAASSSDL